MLRALTSYKVLFFIVFAAAFVTCDKEPTPECDKIELDVAAYIESHEVCQTVDDCDAVSTACGLRGACKTPLAKGMNPELQAKVADWKARGCVGSGPCGECNETRPLACRLNRCIFPEPGAE